MAKKKSIVFINQSSGYLMVDIINAFKEKYDIVSLITGDLNLRNNRLAESVNLSRIMKPKRNSAMQRLFTWSIGFIQICWKVFLKSSEVELFIVSNPPFAPLLPLFFRNKFTLLLFDIYPDALYEHRVVSKESWVMRRWIKANTSIFKKAERIITLTEGMKKRAAQYVDEDKISVVPIWTDNDFFRPISSSENVFVQQNKLENKFVIMYSGNLGFTHNIEILVDLANAFKEQNVEVLIIGEGTKKTLIKEKIKVDGVENCKLLPWQPMDMLPYSFSSAHIGVVSLGHEASSLSLPSKTFNLMSVGVPILGIADADSELVRIINKYEIGECFKENALDDMIGFVNKMIEDKTLYKRLCDNSKKASLDFTPENAKKISAII